MPLRHRPGAGSKPLAHATFTDLVHFLLRVEGPEKEREDGPTTAGRRGGGRGAQAAGRRRRRGAGVARTRLEELDPQPGDTITLGGVARVLHEGLA